MSYTPNGEPGRRRYGCWGGRPNGTPEDRDCCVEQVYGSGMRGMIGHQCQRKRGHGPAGEYCKQHAKNYAPKTAQASAKGDQ